MHEDVIFFYTETQRPSISTTHLTLRETEAQRSKGTGPQSQDWTQLFWTPKMPNVARTVGGHPAQAFTTMDCTY